MQAEAIHAYLVRSYWAAGIPRDVVERAIRGSFCVGAFDGDAQIGFARVVSDGATFAYLADVYVLEAHRGQGIARAMVAALQGLSELQGLRRWILGTRDAHGVYEALGWERVTDTTLFMQRYFPGVYEAAA
ncbi:MAG: family acetyltransferase [Sphingomonas bacterium]|uniref:GNAT family N-acetyltransferase n=1 Tax=Sphingomonas bacterium TaxID=1895847 RepID=UPI00260D0A7F|nr:GNAT family N-acetyltransferase [Sphingomonas bacterium]MDB5706369.1 family acetyltransferase [Sphingomonas bacterium]